MRCQGICDVSELGELHAIHAVCHLIHPKSFITLGGDKQWHAFEMAKYLFIECEFVLNAVCYKFKKLLFCCYILKNKLNSSKW